MNRLSGAVVLAILVSGGASSSVAETIAYWRLENGVLGRGSHNGDQRV